MKKKQINVFSNMFALLKKFDINPKKQIIMAGDFNLLFDSKLDAQGGNPTMKKKRIAKLIELKESYDLCHIRNLSNALSNIFQVSLNVDLITFSF